MPGSYISKVIINGQTKIDLTADTVDPQHLLSGFTAHDRTGAPIEGACSFDANTSDATALAAEILSRKTAYAKGSKVTGTMINNGGVSGSISQLSTPYQIPQGYHDGSGTVGVDSAEAAKLIPDNIREGITILGVLGTMSGSEDTKPQSKEVTPTFSQQEITPDPGYTCLSSVTVKAIPVNETQNEMGGLTLTVG